MSDSTATVVYAVVAVGLLLVLVVGACVFVRSVGAKKNTRQVICYAEPVGHSEDAAPMRIVNVRCVLIALLCLYAFARWTFLMFLQLHLSRRGSI